MRRTPFATALGLVVLLALAGAGCATKTVAPPADEPPAAGSASGAVQRFAWGFNHSDADVVGGLLTDDFVFITAGADSAGNPSGTPSPTPNDRNRFLDLLRALRDSSTTVNIVLDRNLVPFPDSRPGRDPAWHKQVRTSIRVEFHTAGNMTDVVGNALFFVTRGDSAAIPQELRQRGVKPDSTVWWLDRIEDETLSGFGFP